MSGESGDGSSNSRECSILMEIIAQSDNLAQYQRYSSNCIGLSCLFCDRYEILSTDQELEDWKLKESEWLEQIQTETAPATTTPKELLTTATSSITFAFTTTAESTDTTVVTDNNIATTTHLAGSTSLSTVEAITSTSAGQHNMHSSFILVFIFLMNFCFGFRFN